MRYVILFLAAALLASCSTPGRSQADSCDPCSVLDKVKDGGSANLTSGGTRQVQAPQVDDSKGLDANVKTNSGSGGMFSSDQANRRTGLSTGGNQYLGQLVFTPTDGKQESGGRLSPAEIKLSATLDRIERDRTAAADNPQLWAALTSEHQRVSNLLVLAGASNRSIDQRQYNLYLHGAKNLGFGYSKATADNADAGKPTEGTSEVVKAATENAARATEAVMKAEDVSKSVPAFPPSAAMPPLPAVPRLPGEKPASPEAPKPAGTADEGGE